MGDNLTAEQMNDMLMNFRPPIVHEDSLKLPQLVLCYVSDCWAYFTTQKLSNQWGDDWDDAPYEHNAGTPYAFHDSDEKKGAKPWKITRVAWDGDFETPSSNQSNSPWSVKEINAGAVAWLRSSRWNGKSVIIPAGTSLERFCELIWEGGGSVYLRIFQP
jgi:hypothetical protein